MSLYDDIVINTDESKKSTNSGIKLLQDHLKLRKRVERESGAKRFGHGLPRTGFKPRASVSALQPSTFIPLEQSKSTGSLLGGDWDVRQEYDPFKPNDYEKILKEKKEEAKRKEDAKRKELFLQPVVQSMIPGRKLVDGYSDDEDDPVEPTSNRSVGAAIPPPSSLTSSTASASTIASTTGVSFVAAKIMTKMGYKEGSGLGKEEQGISKALIVQKTGMREGKIVAEDEEILAPSSTSSNETNPPITEIIKNPTKVVLLRNMVGPGEVDEDLEPEVKEECTTKYGEVVRCLILELPGPAVVAEEAVRIFVEFKRVEAAIKAVVDLNGRFFGGRNVKATFYDPEKFKKLEKV